MRIALSEHRRIPLYMADAWITPNFLANAEAPQLGPLVPLLLLLPTDLYLKVSIVLFAGAGLAGAYRLARDHGASASLAALGTGIFGCNGFFVSHLAVGHHWVMGAWLLPWLVLLFERALGGSRAALVAAACVDAAVIFGGQHQPFVWQNLLLGCIALHRALRERSLAPLTKLAALALLTFGIGGIKLVPMALEFSDYDPQARIVGLPIALLPLSLLGRAQTPELEVAGLAYHHGAGWWEYAGYLGPLALLALLIGGAGAKRRRPLVLLGVFFLLLALEPSPLWSLFSDLPLLRTQRGPSRFLFLALACLIFAALEGLERWRVRCAVRWPRGTRVVCAALPLLVGADLLVESWRWQRAAVGVGVERVDHRPRPLQRETEQWKFQLEEFAPNRLVYRVEAQRAAQVRLPVHYGKRSAEWAVAVESSGSTLRVPPGAAQRRLSVAVPAGTSRIRLDYRPPGLAAGAVLTGLTLAGILARWARERRHCPRSAG